MTRNLPIESLGAKRAALFFSPLGFSEQARSPHHQLFKLEGTKR